MAAGKRQVILAKDGLSFTAHREDFPVLKRELHGHPYCYLNSAATALKPLSVIEVMDDYYRRWAVSAARGADGISYEVTSRCEAARARIAAFLGVSDPATLVFTRGTTASLNMICRGIGDVLTEPGSEIIVSEQEHHANYVPWQQLALRRSAVLRIVRSEADGRVDLEDLKRCLNDRTKLVCLSHQTNVMGARNPLKTLADLVHEHSSACLVIDGAQGIVHERVRLEESGVDFYAFSAHKLYGPTGVGVFYGRRELLEKMPPVEMGGEMIETVGVFESSFAEIPRKFEAGTMMTAEILGFGAAIEYVERLGFTEMQARTAELTTQALDGLLHLENIEVYNPETAASSGVISFNVKGTHPHDASSVYDRAGIALRAGHHCAQRAMAWLRQKSTLRASFAFYNTEEDAARFIECSKKAGDYIDILF